MIITGRFYRSLILPIRCIMEQNKKGRSKRLATKLMHEVLTLLNENGGEMRSADIETGIEKRLAFDEWESQPYKDGGSRWLSYMHFYSIDFVKAGYIVKNKGRWFLSDEGKAALIKYNAEDLYTAAHQAYLDWSKKQEDVTGTVRADNTDEEDVNRFANIKAQADDDLMDYIQSRTPYEFQDMVAALLRSMGYYTPFVAPKGKDGGIDIIAYSDPLGATKPILKVQVKHYNLNNPVTVDVIRSIVGVAKNDVAIVVTSGRFAEPARQEARQFNVRLIDGYEFSELWIKYFNKMSEDDKARMPIEPIYFIKREEQ